MEAWYEEWYQQRKGELPEWNALLRMLNFEIKDGWTYNL